MSNIILGTMLAACALICIGYFFHRKKNGDLETSVLDILRLQDVFNWIDESFQNVERESGAKYEVNILPNSDTQKLIKRTDKRTYAVVLKKEKGGEKKVVSTKVFFAKSLDVDLDSLKSGQILVIPIE